MKFFRTIAKNFRVLFRLKTALVAIVFGPLFVIFLIGFAFNSSNAIQLTVGYHAPDNSQLTTDFISSLDNKYTTKSFEIERDCLKELEHGLVHTCIFFPPNFEITQGKENNVTFVVDKSRVNLAYTVIEGVSEQIGIKTDELSKSLTETLTSTLTKTGTVVDSTIGSLIKIKKDMNDNVNDAKVISDDLNEIKLEVKDFSFTGTSEIASIDNSLDDIQDEVETVLKEINTTINSLNTTDSKSGIISAINDLNEFVFTEYNDSTTRLSNLTTKISAVQTELNTVEDQIKTAKENTDNSREKIDALRTRLNSINSEVDGVKSNLESLSRDVSSIEITSSDQIVNPINTKIETISSDNNQLISLLPYLLMLIIMFVGLMLASTLVVVEKSSRASFRVFTTPTKDEFFILTTFVTAFIIVIAQLAIILLAVSYFLIDVFTANIGLNILILVLATSIFIMLGMAIGYLIKSQQGANMTSISIGALLLMLSNFVLPVESIVPGLRFIAEYNPYVLASETFRRATIFSMPLNEMLFEIGVLFAFTVVIFILIVIFQKLAKARYFNKNQHAKAKKIEEKKGLWIKNVLVNNELEFIEEVNKLSKEGYHQFIRKNSIKVGKFIKKELNKPQIAKRVRKLSQKELLNVIVKDKQDILAEIKKKHEQRMKEQKSNYHKD
ncbi:ABC transporter permease [Candidatus Woesearchaeota archaeon]|nr:ABC transporter permease [Candidatus Woesearchaeota archaeon]